jgi:DNA replication protein DnaC
MGTCPRHEEADHTPKQDNEVEINSAMIDRLVHAEVIALEGDSYRLKDRNLGRVPTAVADEQ